MVPRSGHHQSADSQVGAGNDPRPRLQVTEAVALNVLRLQLARLFAGDPGAVGRKDGQTGRAWAALALRASSVAATAGTPSRSAVVTI